MNPLTIDALMGANRVLLYGGFVLFAGTLSFWVLVWPDGHADHRQRRLVGIGLGLTAVTTVLGPLLQWAEGGGRSFVDVVSREVLVSALVRLAVVAVVAAGFGSLVGRRTSGRRRAAGAAAVVTTALTLVTASDAMAGHLVPLKILATTGHVLATAAWLGGLVSLAVVIIPRRHLLELDELIPGFSRVAFVSVVTLTVTGAIHAVAQAGGIRQLAVSDYGLVLALKTVMFAAMLVLGNHGRRYANQVVLRRLQREGVVTESGVHTLAVVMGAEVATAVALLLTTSLLVAVAPLP